MKFSRLFTGKPYHEIEKNADALFQMGEYASAKLEYERALHKSAKKAPDAHDHLDKKIAKCKNALALEHRKTAEDLMEAGLHGEAEDLLRLASELVQDERLAAEIEDRLMHVKTPPLAPGISRESVPGDPLEGEGEFAYQESETEYFAALVNTLSKPEQEVYHGYNEPFREGYVKLNQGYFEEAVMLLSRALETNDSSTGFIRLELASAHLNLGHDDEGCLLLEGFLKASPESLRAYPALCDLYWQNKEFDKAQRLLTNCPEPLKDSPVIHLLMGETYFHAGQYHDAENHFLDYLSTHGGDEAIALALAKTFEAMGSKEKARRQYAEIMNRCQGCGRSIDPLIKQKFADISLETGDHSASILELYLGLVQEVPENRSDYYQKISRIYELNGNEDEALRFNSFAEQSRHEK